MGASARGTPRVPPVPDSGTIPVSDLAPGQNGQEVETVSGVAAWTFDADDTLIVASLGALSATDMSLRGDSQMAYVQSLRSYFIYDQTSALTSDGITIVNATGGGRWLRQPMASLAWANQAAWFCDPTTGSDENSGATSLLPVKTLAELDRRLSNQTLQQTTTVSLLGSYASEYLKFHNVRIAANLANAGGNGPFRFIIRSPSTAWTTFYTSNVAGITSFQSVTRVAAGVRYAVTDNNLGVTDPATFIGRRIRLTTGANAGATSWVLKKLSATQFATGPFIAAINETTATTFIGTIVTPVAGDRYVIEDVVGLKGIEIVTGPSRMDVRDGTASLVVASPILTHVDVGQGGTTEEAISDSNIVITVDSFGVDGIPRPVIYASRIASRVASTGPTTIIGSLFACPSSIEVHNGGQINTSCFLAIGAAVGTPVTATLATNIGVTIPLSGDTTSQGVSIAMPQGTLMSVNITGFGIYDCVGIPLTISPGSTLTPFLPIYGTNPSVSPGGAAVRVQSGGQLRFTAGNKPVITADVPGTNDVQLDDGSFTGPWASVPLALPGLGKVVADNTGDFGKAYRTAVAAAIGATNLCSATPDKGLYTLEVYLAVTTPGNAGDTCTVTIAWTDDAQAESVAVISLASVAARGQFQARRLVETNGATNVTYAVAFPTKVGAPQISLRIAMRLLQNSLGESVPQAAPNTIANNALWLSADSGVTLDVNGVTQVDDKSGNGNNATQGTAGLEMAQVVDTDGRLAIGENANAAAKSMALPAGFYNFWHNTSGQPFTLIVLARRVGTISTANVEVLAWGNVNYSPIRFLAGAVGSKYGHFFSSTAAGNWNDSQDANWHVLATTFTGTSNRFYLDNVEDALSPIAIVAAACGAAASINARNSLWREYAVFERVLTASEILLVSNYMLTHWGLPPL